VAGPATSLPPLDITRAPEGGNVGAVQSGWRLALREFASNRMALVGIGILLFFVVFCFLGPHIYHGNETIPNPAAVDAPPGAGHPLGGDDDGFDVLAELMIGGQSALEIGVFSALIGLILGTLLGAVSGLFGGLVDATIMRLVDIFLSVPFLFAVLILAVRYGSTVLLMSVVIGIASWPVPARLVRGEVLTIRERDFVLAARTAGAGRWRLIFRHLLPNTISVTIVNGTFQVADAILLIASIGYLGFGLHYPQIDWGDMLSNGTNEMSDGYWWLIYPAGVCIVLVVMAFNFIGDALRDSVDVRLRRR
jgi:ABC-type dipeptide/oligopeptide/nickel transport system permease subunit